MVATAKITATAKNLVLAPVYLYQGRQVKRNTLRLPEPDGERFGHVQLQPVDDHINGYADGCVNSHVTIKTTANPRTLNLMIVGDSAAAGVGSATQQQALAGKLIPALQQQPVISAQFTDLNWSLQATTGHTSFDILRRLYVISTPEQPVDVMVLSLGVNDTTANVSSAKWRHQLEQIIAIAKRKFGVRVLIFSSLPPMAQMPALPTPLNHFIGAKASKLDQVLQQVCAEHNDVHYMATDFKRMAQEYSNGNVIDAAAMFASDGFHPSSVTYGYWAQQLAALINELIGGKAKEH